MQRYDTTNTWLTALNSLLFAINKKILWAISGQKVHATSGSEQQVKVILQTEYLSHELHKHHKPHKPSK